jgi:hypothetical protein
MPAGCGLYVNGRKIVLEQGLWDAQAQSLPVHLTSLFPRMVSGFGGPNPFDGSIANDFEVAVSDSEKERDGNLNLSWH